MLRLFSRRVNLLQSRSLGSRALLDREATLQRLRLPLQPRQPLTTEICQRRYRRFFRRRRRLLPFDRSSSSEADAVEAVNEAVEAVNDEYDDDDVLATEDAYESSKALIVNKRSQEAKALTNE